MDNKIISKTQNGQVFKCNKCNLIHIEYKNLNFNFTEKQYKQFADYLSKLNGKEWEEKNKYSKFERKILIPIGEQNFRVLLNNNELNELKKLFFVQNTNLGVSQKIKIQNMNFTLILN